MDFQRFEKMQKITNKTPERQTTPNIQQKIYKHPPTHTLSIRLAERLFFKSKSVAATSLF